MESRPTIGEAISPILSEVEEALWEHEAMNAGPPMFTDDGMRASIKIFMSVLMDRMWRLQRNENMSMEDRMKMAETLGSEMHKMVKTFTDIDTKELYSTSQH